ncbi:MAG: shikimate kinase [Clostridiales bacterium]|nr:shikimate kinase [Clostridiales bacterium]
MKKVDNIILIGFMGSGKTTVGKLLAKNLAFDFLDTDEMIEAEEAMTVQHIFSTHGEEKFRELETSLLLSISNSLENSVLSTGGGMPIKEINIKLLKAMGKIIYLRTSIDTIIDRVSGDTNRPLLKGNNLKESVERLLDSRLTYYEDAADIIIDTDGFEVKEIVDKILMTLKDK